MATVTLDVDNWVMLGREISGQYVEQFGKILDFAPDETTPGVHWLKIKMMIDIQRNSIIDDIQNINSRELTSVPKLEVYPADEGQSILEHFRTRIADREARNNERAERPRTARAVRTTPTTEDEPRPETDQAVESDMNDDEVEQERTIGRMPVAISDNSEEIQPVLKAFSINLGTGDMKTIMKIAEKDPAKVFDIVDRAVLENGHTTLNYIDSNLRSIFIDLKINNLSSFSSITLKKNASYVISNSTHSTDAVYLGENYWVLPEGGATLEEIAPGFVKIDSSILKKYSIVEEIERSGAILLSCESIIDEIDSDFRSDMEHFEEAKITVTNSTALEKITNDLLGDAWVSTITYYYFMGGDLKWDALDLSSFSTADSIHKLASSKNDTKVLEMLQVA